MSENDQHRPIEPQHHAQMNALAEAIDEVFNGKAKHPNKKTGFVLLVFPFGDAKDGRANYISNGANRKDIAILFREMAARFDGMPSMEGMG